MSILNPSVKIGDLYMDTDLRNVDFGKTGRAKGKPRVVEIIALPTLSSPGVLKVKKAPKQPHTVGALRRFTFSKLEQHYTKVA